MGITPSNLFARLFAKKQLRILMVGLDDAGKTTILYKLMGDDGKTTSTVPTVGLNVETLQYKNIEFTVWDIDGRCITTLLSRHYFKNTHGIIFVIDSHDRERFLEARDKLQEMLEEEELTAAAVLVFANKQDLPNAVNAAELTDKLNKLKELKDRKWHIQPASAIQGCRLQEGIRWLSRELSK